MLRVYTENLGLAGTGDRAVGATRGTAIGVALLSSRGGDLEVSHIDQRLLASVAAGASGLGSLVVGGNVEGDEKNQVGADDANTSQGSEFLAGALAHVGHPGEVGRGEVGIGGEVDEALGWSVCHNLQ